MHAQSFNGNLDVDSREVLRKYNKAELSQGRPRDAPYIWVP